MVSVTHDTQTNLHWCDHILVASHVSCITNLLDQCLTISPPKQRHASQVQHHSLIIKHFFTSWYVISRKPRGAQVLSTTYKHSINTSKLSTTPPLTLREIICNKSALIHLSKRQKVISYNVANVKFDGILFCWNSFKSRKGTRFHPYNFQTTIEVQLFNCHTQWDQSCVHNPQKFAGCQTHQSYTHLLRTRRSKCSDKTLCVQTNNILELNRNS